MRTWIKIFLILLICSLAQAANDFSGDPNCVALWRFESGALGTDSKNGNDLTNDGVDEDTSDYKEGSCSGAFVRANTDIMYRSDSNLSNNFPLKSGTSNQTFSFAFWIRSDNISLSQVFCAKGTAAGSRCIESFIYTSHIVICVSENGSSWNELWHSSVLSSNTWYHVAFTKNADDDNWRIRIHDSSSLVGTDATGTVGDLNFVTNSFYLGSPTSFPLGGNLDEFVVFNKALTVNEIDQIWAGTYGAAAGGGGGQVIIISADGTPSFNDWYQFYKSLDG